MKKGFTLVELIVVIAILAILGVTGFSYYQGYIKDARNSNRMQFLQQVQTMIESYYAKEGRLPQCQDGTDTAPTDGIKDVGDCVFAKYVAASPKVGESTDGIDATDWAKIPVSTVPTDPNGATIYFKYAHNKSEYEIAATYEGATNYATVLTNKEPDNTNTVTMTGVSCTTPANVQDGLSCLPYALP